MRRGRRSRRDLNQLESLRGNQQNHQNRRSGGRRHRPDSSIETITLRRSARLNRNLGESIAARAIEAETIRETLRRRSRLPEQPHVGNNNSELLHSARRNHSPNTPPSEPDIMHQSANVAMNGGDRSYTLELAYPLPRRAQAGTLMNPPIAVRLQIRNTTTGSEITGQDELGYLFLNISLRRETGNGQPLTQNASVQGSVASFEPINDPSPVPANEEPNGVLANSRLDRDLGSFAHFSSWIVHRSGNYRVQFNLFRLEQQGSPLPGSRNVGAGHRFVTSMISSDILVVQDDPVSPFYDSNTLEFINHVRATGSSISAPAQ